MAVSLDENQTFFHLHVVSITKRVEIQMKSPLPGALNTAIFDQYLHDCIWKRIRDANSRCNWLDTVQK